MTNNDNRYFKTEIVNGEVKIVPKEWTTGHQEFGKSKISMEQEKILLQALRQALDEFRIKISTPPIMLRDK